MFNDTLPARGPLVSSREAAEMLDVHPSTIKRWCDAGELACRLTPGGHRRIALDDAIDLAEARGIPCALRGLGTRAGAVWRAVDAARARGDFGPLVDVSYDLLVAEDDAEAEASGAEVLVRSIVLLARHGIGLHTALDQVVAGVARRLGDAWQAGAIEIGDEHRTTERLFDALYALRAELSSEAAAAWPPARSAAPGVAIVGAAEGNHHDLPALMLRILLEHLGWHVRYLGANVPTRDIGAQQLAARAQVVCLSFTPPQSAADARRITHLLARAYEPSSPYALALGGAGLDPFDLDLAAMPFVTAARFDAFEPLPAWLDALPAPASVQVPAPSGAAAAASAQGRGV